MAREQGPDVRDRVVVTTKTFNPMDEGEDRGLSAARIRRSAGRACAASGSSGCPLHGARLRPDTPQEETLSGFDELVRAGTVGAVGASNFTAEQLAEALELSAIEGLVRYEWAQNALSLLEQRDRETVFPLCHEHGLGFTPFSPLAGGWLTGKYRAARSRRRRVADDLRPRGGELPDRRDVRRPRGVRARLAHVGSR